MFFEKKEEVNSQRKKMSCSDENRPSVSNVYHSKGEELKEKKTNELINKPSAETVTNVPKPVAGGKKFL